MEGERDEGEEETGDHGKGQVSTHRCVCVFACVRAHTCGGTFLWACHLKHEQHNVHFSSSTCQRVNWQYFFFKGAVTNFRIVVCVIIVLYVLYFWKFGGIINACREELTLYTIHMYTYVMGFLWLIQIFGLNTVFMQQNKMKGPQ